MKEQVALIKQDQFNTAPNPITEFWARFEQTTKQIEKRAYQLFEARGRQNGHALEDWLQAEAELLVPISVTTSDKHNELHIRAEVPGFKSDEVSFNLEKNLLTIHAAQNTHNERISGETIRTQSGSKMICRKVTLPCAVVPEKLEASLKNGVLEIIAPKALVVAKTNAATAA